MPVAARSTPWVFAAKLSYRWRTCFGFLEAEDSPCTAIDMRTRYLPKRSRVPLPSEVRDLLLRCADISDYSLVFIPGCLERSMQVVLRHLMRKSAAKSDGPGFIYALKWIGESFSDFVPICFATTRSLLDHSDPDLIRIKVGRSNDVARRLSEHRRRCPSARPILLGRSCLSPHCDRLERLIHVELADRAAQSYPAGRTAPLAKCKDCMSRC